MRKKLIKLTNGCSRTEIFISPKEYLEFTKSNFKTKWFIECRFHDPKHKDKYPNGFPYRRRFSSSNLDILKLTAKIYVEEMEDLLDNKKYNPITETYMTERVVKIHPYIPFVEALRSAHKKLKSDWSPNHAKEVNRCIDHIEKIKYELEFDKLLISDIKTWHIKTILDGLELTNSVYNHSISYLMALFKELTQYGCATDNPVNSITRKVEEIKIREVITKEDLRFVLKFLQDKHYTFYQYAQIFFYAAGRSTELMSVQKKHVDIKKQEYKVLIKKKKQYTWVKKVIIRSSIPFWKEVLSECQDDDDYLFSEGLVPGEKSISPKQISRRWKRHVKDTNDIKDDEGNILKVTADFYTLKHLFLDILDEINSSRVLNIQELQNVAQRMANHDSDDTTSIYTTGRTGRKNNDLKNLIIT
ncbi:tyrosine-type recombinase/integrase [Chryseobacterium sp. YR221]|uniref:tyrosine-type recombinase/integrase n=1 Tax=Chryseobacterium sp. YR221 TaxID=1500293 RepID=UPI0009D7D464|nr:tyrosine-type recombinase/integrase [Chryseobacterium sp. YR221]SMC86900.1 Phage integrase family protein [Chryseobacterium sp. YR221]